MVERLLTLDNLGDLERLEVLCGSDHRFKVLRNTLRRFNELSDSQPITNQDLLNFYNSMMGRLHTVTPIGVGRESLVAVENYLFERDLVSFQLYGRILDFAKTDKDSTVRFAIPLDVAQPDYELWLDKHILGWLREEGNSEPKPLGVWEMPYDLDGLLIDGRNFKMVELIRRGYIPHVGVYLRAHFSIPNVEQVHSVADRLDSYLSKNGIDYTRINERRFR